MKYTWSLAPTQPLLAGRLATSLGISPLLAQCLLNRGFSEVPAIENFLAPRLKHLADPFLLPDMEKAVDRLFRAREQNETVVIFGDYDVDGVTSTTLLLQVLRPLGWRVEFYLPNRMEEGYGLSPGGVENCLKKFSTTLLLAVDCGSTAVEPIAGARERGVDVIVLDHHQISQPAPEAVALVNPQASAKHTHTELCSAGLAFKLAHALVKRGREKNLPGMEEFDLKPLLDLVALGTIADLVPLSGENRILASAGLRQLNVTQRPGIMALKKVAQTHEPVGVYEVGFQLGPRLNASGRLETAEESLRLLLAQNLETALPLAERLDSRNRERQKIEKTIVREAVATLRMKFDPTNHFVIVEGQLLWHIGVVGIVASRVLHEFYRPTIIIGGENGEMRGSGRSIAGFDLAAALRECDHLLVRHGGHAMAAGLSILPDKIDLLREKLNELARRTLKPDDLKPSLNLDAEVGLDEMTFESLGELEKLKPHGQGNPATQFCARNLSHAKPVQRIGADKQHVKMRVTDGAATHEAVWWNSGEKSLPVGKFDLAFAPQINAFNGSRMIQLKVLDWRPAE
ncbi:MAG TPA: single-stranded-DNA-specific exonuclease RecJ [Candidatus Acidoferrales bacterium]|jgi:single-stranded-DNA-specific exonuclease|nr:single-stranded-DNA-specific exonuclease RecJ [Candidatus Acidoferrales bacterium]